MGAYVDIKKLIGFPAVTGNNGKYLKINAGELVYDTPAPLSGGANYIQNQNSSAQSTSNFWISGNGRASTLTVGGAGTVGVTNYYASNDGFQGSFGSDVSGGGRLMMSTGMLLLQHTSGSGTSNVFQIQSQNPVHWNLGGQQRVKIMGQGNGDTPSLFQLYSSDSAATTNNVGIGFSLNRTTGGETMVARIAGAISDISNAAYKGALSFQTANNAAPVERMRIDHAGNVGIGTSSPAAKLHISEPNTNVVAGYIFTGGGGPALIVGQNGSRAITLGHTSGDLTIAGLNAGSNGFNISGYSSKLSLNTDNPAYPITLNPGSGSGNVILYGNVGVGTSSPGARLHVSGQNPNNYVRLLSGDSSSSFNAIEMVVNDNGLDNFGSSSFKMHVEEGNVWSAVNYDGTSTGSYYVRPDYLLGEVSGTSGSAGYFITEHYVQLNGPVKVATLGGFGVGYKMVVTDDEGTLSYQNIPTSNSGTVTTVSVTSANGFSGSVSNATSTPQLTLSTSVTNNKILYANAGALTGSNYFTWDNSLKAFTVEGQIIQSFTEGDSTTTFNVTGEDGVSIYTVGDDDGDAITGYVSATAERLYTSYNGFNGNHSRTQQAVEGYSIVVTDAGEEVMGSLSTTINQSTFGNTFNTSNVDGVAMVSTTYDSTAESTSVQLHARQEFGVESVLSVKPESIELDSDSYTFKGSAAPVKVEDLAGSGNRMVVASSTGVLSTQAIPGVYEGPTVESGTYTPTVTNVTNVSAFSLHNIMYSRLGDYATVEGMFTLTPTAAGNFEMMFSLPVASALSSANDVFGMFSSKEGYNGYFEAYTALGTAYLKWTAPGTSAVKAAFRFTYQIYAP